MLLVCCSNSGNNAPHNARTNVVHSDKQNLSGSNFFAALFSLLPMWNHLFVVFKPILDASCCDPGKVTPHMPCCRCRPNLTRALLHSRPRCGVDLAMREMGMLAGVDDSSLWAWVDAGFNHYRLYRPEVSPAPWLTFWPTYGVAFRMHANACNCHAHDVCWSRYGDHHRCIYGAFFSSSMARGGRSIS